MDPLHGYQPQGVIVFLGAAYIIIYYGIIFIKWLIHTIRYQLDDNYRNDEIAQEKRATEAKNLADNGPIASYFRRMGDTATAYEKRAAEAKKQAAEAEKQAAEAEKQATEAEKQATEAKKQADETALANATQITMPVAPSAAATIPSQTTAVTANTDTTYNGYYTTATQIPAVTANTDTTYNGYYTTATQIPAVTANTTQRDQLDNNFKNEMMEAEKRAVEAEKRAVEAEKRVAEVEKRAAKAKKQTTAAKKQADGTDLSNATQTTVPVAPSVAVAVPPRSLDERINALLKMKASGLITDAEFDQKRKELLDSI